ncbi:hypothetical protein R50072_39370 [Simiduia litorea]|uniref:hypothetical protein n=1 Tax=Simiduia litorea TaxID=1435348 RepID=UPI0036F1D4EA
MKYLVTISVFLLTILCCKTTSAALITYSYDSPIHNANNSYHATAIITVDDQSRKLVEVDFSSDPFAFFWQGEVGLMYDQPVSDSDSLYQNGFHSFSTAGITFSLYLDYFYLAAGEDLFHNLHKTHPYEGASITNTLIGETLWLAGTLSKIDTIEVHETTSATLLFIGLLLLAIRRKNG